MAVQYVEHRDIDGLSRCISPKMDPMCEHPDVQESVIPGPIKPFKRIIQGEVFRDLSVIQCMVTSIV